MVPQPFVHHKELVLCWIQIKRRKFEFIVHSIDGTLVHFLNHTIGALMSTWRSFLGMKTKQNLEMNGD